MLLYLAKYDSNLQLTLSNSFKLQEATAAYQFCCLFHFHNTADCPLAACETCKHKSYDSSWLGYPFCSNSTYHSSESRRIEWPPLQLPLGGHRAAIQEPWPHIALYRHIRLAWQRLQIHQSDTSCHISLYSLNVCHTWWCYQSQTLQLDQHRLILCKSACHKDQ